jgi:hypothetical protein
MAAHRICLHMKLSMASQWFWAAVITFVYKTRMGVQLIPADGSSPMSVNGVSEIVLVIGGSVPGTTYISSRTALNPKLALTQASHYKLNIATGRRGDLLGKAAKIRQVAEKS